MSTVKRVALLEKCTPKDAEMIKKTAMNQYKGNLMEEIRGGPPTQRVGSRAGEIKGGPSPETPSPRNSMPVRRRAIPGSIATLKLKAMRAAKGMM